MKIKRTAMANRPRATVWVSDEWGQYPNAPYTDTVFEGEYPTHSMVLGPDGEHLEYEPRPPMGFDLRSRK